MHDVPAPTTTPFRENLIGIGAITACNFLSLINDSCLKLASEELPLGQIIAMRGGMVTLFLIPIVWMSGAFRYVHLLPNWHVVSRTVAEIASAFLYLLAVFHIPIANTNAILQVVPLMVTAAGAIFLGEKVGWRRWTAIAVGFAGVMIVVRPGFSGFNAYALVALASMLFITLRDMNSRMMPLQIPALLIALVTGFFVGLSGPGIALFLDETWVMPSSRSTGLIAVAILFLVGGYLTSVIAMRHGDISVVAPFRYSVIIWAMIVGYLIFGDVPDAPMLAGTAIIIATGVYTFHREHRTARLKAEAMAGEGM
jgi:drug/metabolite transporter (DMT)-like permease